MTDTCLCECYMSLFSRCLNVTYTSCINQLWLAISIYLVSCCYIAMYLQDIYIFMTHFKLAIKKLTFIFQPNDLLFYTFKSDLMSLSYSDRILPFDNISSIQHRIFLKLGLRLGSRVVQEPQMFYSHLSRNGTITLFFAVA